MALLQTVLQVILSPVYRSQAVFPAFYSLRIFQILITRHELSQMTVTGCSDQAIAAEQVEFYAVAAGKRRVCPVGVSLFKAFFKMLIHIFFVNREQVNSLVRSIIKPGKVVDAKYVYINILSGNIFQSVNLLYDSAQNLLSSEYFVAAAKCFNLREYMIQSLYAQAHRVGVVDDPCLGSIIADRFCNGDIHRDGTQCTDDSARASCITN